MGWTRHHAIIVTAYDEDRLRAARERALTIFGAQVSSVVESEVNGIVSFLVGPDGSNDGWEDSDTGDTRRDEFVTWLNAQRFEDGGSWLAWVEVEYHDDEDSARVTRDDRSLAAPDSEAYAIEPGRSILDCGDTPPDTGPGSQREG